MRKAEVGEDARPRVRVGADATRMTDRVAARLAAKLLRAAHGRGIKFDVVDVRPPEPHLRFTGSPVDRELALGLIDISVHHLPEVVATPPFTLAAFLPRHYSADCSVGADLAALAEGARVGVDTGLRAGQLRRAHPHLEPVMIAGSLGQRIARIGTDRIAAVIASGYELDLIGHRDDAYPLPLHDFATVAGQGVTVLRTLRSRPDIAAFAQAVHHEDTMTVATAERAAVAGLDTRHSFSAGVDAFLYDGSLHVSLRLITSHGRLVAEACRSGPPGDAAGLAQTVAGCMWDKVAVAAT